MPKASFISIRYKLVLLMMLVSIIVVSISSLLLYKNEVEILESSAIESGQTQAAMIGFSVKSAIIFDDSLSATSTLSLFEKNEQVEYAVVTLSSGEVFAEYRKHDTLDELGSKPPETTPLLEESVSLGTTSLEITTVISDHNDTIGFLSIRTSLDKLHLQRQYYRNMLLYVLAISFLVAGILSLVAQRIITQPLNVMVRYVRELSGTKDYSKRLHLKQRDELGTLASGFNHMLNVVEERENALKTQRRNLQNIVNERTKQLYRKAHFDSLTGLPNRYLLNDRLEHAILTARRTNNGLGILFLDLDRFKVINDSLGHDVGDQLLKAAASRLQEIGRDSDTIARLGGDEFIYLVEAIEKPDDAGRVAQKIIDAFSEPFVLNDNILHVSTSIGISFYPDDGVDSGELLKNADLSMYHAKAQGPGNYSFYRSDMNKAIHQRLAIENELRNAIANNEFHLLYQPIISIATNKVEKVEALLRWDNPILGRVSPATFIPIVEEIGMINQVGKWVIDEACRQQNAWGNKRLKIAVNVSTNQLLDVDLVNYVKSVAKKHQTNLSDIEFEITEEVFLEQSAVTIARLKNLRELGVKIAIDDFGTGYSSLSYLKELPIDTLKLDGMFVMDVTENKSSQGIVAATVILAHSLNMKIVAECVESAEQLQYLGTKNCDYAQGFHIHKPLLPDDVIQLV